MEPLLCWITSDVQVCLKKCACISDNAASFHQVYFVSGDFYPQAMHAGRSANMLIMYLLEIHFIS